MTSTSEKLEPPPPENSSDIGPSVLTQLLAAIQALAPPPPPPPPPPESTLDTNPSAIDKLLTAIHAQTVSINNQAAAIDKLVLAQDEALKEQRQARDEQRTWHEEQRKWQEEQERSSREQTGMLRTILLSKEEPSRDYTTPVRNPAIPQGRSQSLAGVGGPSRPPVNSRIASYRSTYGVPTTPTSHQQLPACVVQSVMTTPMSGTAVIKSTNAAYRDLANANAERFSLDVIETVLGTINNNWFKAWDDETANDTHASDVQSILASIEISNPGAGDDPGKNKEEIYQERLSVLMTAIENHLRGRNNEPIGLQWKDKHHLPMPNNRKPDGVLMVSAQGVDDKWADVAVTFEAKSDRFSASDSVLRGQLLSDFRDMAYDQPRRYSLGFGVSRDGKVYMHTCTMDEIKFSYIGSLSCVSASDLGMNNLIRFLLVLYEQLPKDNYGFLVPEARGIVGAFCAGDISGFHQPGQGGILKTARIMVKDCAAFSGRRRDNFGPRSWLYFASLRSGETTIYDRVILKLNWCLHRHCETSVHRIVKSLDVPYTPQLFDSATVSFGYNHKYICEMLLIENGGTEVNAYYKHTGRHNTQLIVDVFAGYFHTLLVAAAGKDDLFILHRDISAGNLLVKDNKPYVIDWGCGLVAKRDENRSIPEGSLVGTTPYMSIRVLSQARYRSLLDDLESLFLVFSFCLWNRFGDKQSVLSDKKFADLWNGSQSVTGTSGLRKPWLFNQRSFWDHMNISKDCPDSLQTFACGMYDLLFSDSLISASDLDKTDHDPRIAGFEAKDWAEVFRVAADSAVCDGHARFSHVDALCEYVRENPSCALISVDQPKLPETPTKERLKRSLSSEEPDYLASKIPRFSINQ